MHAQWGLREIQKKKLLLRSARGSFNVSVWATIPIISDYPLSDPYNFFYHSQYSHLLPSTLPPSISLCSPFSSLYSLSLSHPHVSPSAFLSCAPLCFPPPTPNPHPHPHHMHSHQSLVCHPHPHHHISVFPLPFSPPHAHVPLLHPYHAYPHPSASLLQVLLPHPPFPYSSYPPMFPFSVPLTPIFSFPSPPCPFPCFIFPDTQPSPPCSPSPSPPHPHPAPCSHSPSPSLPPPTPHPHLPHTYTDPHALLPISPTPMFSFPISSTPLPPCSYSRFLLSPKPLSLSCS